MSVLKQQHSAIDVVLDCFFVSQDELRRLGATSSAARSIVGNSEHRAFVTSAISMARNHPHDRNLAEFVEVLLASSARARGAFIEAVMAPVGGPFENVQELVAAVGGAQ